MRSLARSSTLEKPIALGRTAEIYAWGDGQVLKLFYDWVSPVDVRFEAEQTRRALAAGQRVPAVKDEVQIDGRPGLVLERVDGESLFQVMTSQPWRFGKAARLLAVQHVQMHALSGLGLPRQKERLRRKLLRAGALDEPLQQKLLAELERLPDGEALCHGDFHPYNIQMSADGPVVIDWIDASCGHPLADVARSLLVMSLGEPTSRASKLVLGLISSGFRKTYLKHYLQLSGYDEAQVRAWLPVIAAARLSENVPGEQGALLRIAAGQ